VHLPAVAARLVARFGIAPLLDPRLPVVVRRRLLDAVGFATPVPRGTRRASGLLGGVPTVAVSAAGETGAHRVLYLHGGGYQVGSPHSYRGLLGHLSRAAGAPVLAPTYRLAPEHPYPAGLDDVLAAYRALRSAGHQAQHIAVAGDSAGGGLAMSLVLRLCEAGEELPGSVGLISPWLDLTVSAPAITANATSDLLLDPRWMPLAAKAYGGPADAADLRPLEADLAGLPPLHVVAASGEVLIDDADRLVERARAAGVPVTYERAEGLWHAFPVLVGLMAEADAAVEALGAALRADCSV
jgi:epsilon-lactone hydrolase